MSFKKKILSFAKSLSMAFHEKQIIPIMTPVDNEALLKGKNAIVIGGSGGIGFSIAKRLLESGANVIITGRNQHKVENIALGLGDKAVGASLDLSDVQQIKKRIPQIIHLFDTPAVDILVNAAGINSFSSFLDVTEEDYDRIMDTNLKGLFFVTQAVSQHMIDNKTKGHILNVSSASALRPAWGPYQISKWGVNGFTKGLADTLLPYGIICNGIAPGPVATPMLNKQEGDTLFNSSNPSGRYASPVEIANLALFLVSSMGDLIVGETYVISGGGGTISYHK